MLPKICITNRKLCEEDFLDRLKKVCKKNPYRIVLREKDLDEASYLELARNVKDLCEEENVTLILHSFPNVAKKLGVRRIHLPLGLLQNMAEEELDYFEEIGTSVHSLEDVRLAKDLGATYLIAGHIFETDCKKGLPGRGLDFLKQVCECTSLPVFAIGGITDDNIHLIEECNATGVAIMSGFMVGEI
ncbi:MAG: thiamine phosphate synthase [Lachnospiraceae bacterium]|nr:thiamine phosphate synthase [Lachnospiraceae bacterium]